MPERIDIRYNTQKQTTYKRSNQNGGLVDKVADFS